MERIFPMNDFVLKKLFGEQRDKDLLQNFLVDILSERNVDVTLKEEKLSRETIADKLSILDIKAQIQTEKQMAKKSISKFRSKTATTCPRTLFYWAKLYRRHRIHSTS